MKNILFLFILLGLSVSLKAQTTICPPTTTCSQPGTGISVTAHVVDTSSNVNPTYAQSLNLNSPQRYFCLGDPIDLRGLWNPSIGLTDARWDLISASCANVTLPAGTVLSTGSVTWPNGQIVSSSNQSRIAVPSQPGYYIFMFSGKTTNCPVVFDTAFVYVFPTFAANAGPNFIACDTSNLAGYAYMQELNSPQSTLPSGYIGTWEWASNSPDYFIDSSDINNPNAILHAKPLAYGSFTPSHWFRWKVENILTGCFSYDYVNIYFPNGQPVYAGADRTICSYGTSFQTNNCGAGECISNPGAGSVYWVPGTAYPSGYTTDPPSYFWWEFEGTYVAYPGTGYTLASPPTISYGGGYVTYFTAGLTGLGYPDTYAAGTYTIIYHVRGYCVEGDDTVKITFKLPEAITAPTNLTDVVMCNALRNLSENAISTLTSIDAKQGMYAAKAKDLLQAANGKNDYRFEKTKSLSLTSNRDIINISEINLKVYPNPASNNLTLELVNASDENATISIFDAIGQRIYQAPANIKAGKISIDISSFAKGLYHVQLLSAENKSLSSSFIKQ